MNELLQERIRAGASWLDQHESGWRDRVQVIDLQLSNACTCVLGQVFSRDAEAQYNTDSEWGAEYGPTMATESGSTYFGGYWYVMNEAKLSAHDAHQLGFDHQGGQDPYTWADMTTAWRGFLKGEWT